MKKNFMFGSAIVAMLLLGTGCGGGSSSSDDDSSAEASVSTEKTGYYLDSAVGGVSYSCVSNDSSSSGDGTASNEDDSGNEEGTASDGDSSGSEDGTASDGDSSDSEDGTASDGDSSDSEDETASNDTSSDDNSTAQKSKRLVQKAESATTGADGSFTFQNGQTCTFSVAGVVLRKVDTTGLADKAIVLEDNLDVARFLQTLDNNDNPADGIQIDPAVSASMASDGLLPNGAIPATDEGLTNLVTQLQESVESYHGQIVTREQAQSHLADTEALVESLNGIMSPLLNNSPKNDEEESTEGSGEGEGEGTSEGSSSADANGDESSASGSSSSSSSSTGGSGSSSGSTSTPTSPASPTAPTSPTAPVSSPSTGGFGL
jgi:hypothetical protein